MIVPAFPGFFVATLIEGDETMLRREAVIAWNIDADRNIAGLPIPITCAGEWTIHKGSDPYVLVKPYEARRSDSDLTRELKHLWSLALEKLPLTQT